MSISCKQNILLILTPVFQATKLVTSKAQLNTTKQTIFMYCANYLAEEERLLTRPYLMFRMTTAMQHTEGCSRMLQTTGYVHSQWANMF
jgi:hypothetical protein